jgi:hypothetical protein
MADKFQMRCSFHIRQRRSKTGQQPRTNDVIHMVAEQRKNDRILALYLQGFRYAKERRTCLIKSCCRSDSLDKNESFSWLIAPRNREETSFPPAGARMSSCRDLDCAAAAAVFTIPRILSICIERRLMRICMMDSLLSFVLCLFAVENDSRNRHILSILCPAFPPSAEN